MGVRGEREIAGTVRGGEGGVGRERSVRGWPRRRQVGGVFEGDGAYSCQRSAMSSGRVIIRQIKKIFKLKINKNNKEIKSNKK